MSADAQSIAADLARIADTLLANEKGLLFNAADPERRLKLEADARFIRSQLQPLRVVVAKLERVDRMITKALKRVKPRLLA